MKMEQQAQAQRKNLHCANGISLRNGRQFIRWTRTKPNLALKLIYVDTKTNSKLCGLFKVSTILSIPESSSLLLFSSGREQ